MSKLFANPVVRLALRALLAGVLAAAALLQGSSPSDGSVAWKSAAVGGIMAFCEVLTPLNQLVGPFKAAPKKG